MKNVTILLIPLILLMVSVSYSQKVAIIGYNGSTGDGLSSRT